MGDGMYYKCKKCKHEYDIHLGIGMGYPRVYRRTVEAALNGEYGEEWQQLMNRKKYMDIKADYELYQCSCGNWYVSQDLSIYEPKDEAIIENTQYGIKNVKEWGYVPYVMWFEREQNYRFVKSFIHKCDKCGKRMHKVDEDKSEALSCPKCGTVNEPEGMLNWD